MVDPDLDLARLTELQELLGRRLPDIVETLVTELGSAFDTMNHALAAGDLQEVALAAHAARNSALMIDARPLLGQLGALETGARRNDVATAVAVHEQLLVAWASLRRRLELAAAGGV